MRASCSDNHFLGRHDLGPAGLPRGLQWFRASVSSCLPSQSVVRAAHVLVSAGRASGSASPRAGSARASAGRWGVVSRAGSAHTSAGRRSLWLKRMFSIHDVQWRIHMRANSQAGSSGSTPGLSVNQSSTPSQMIRPASVSNTSVLPIGLRNTVPKSLPCTPRSIANLGFFSLADVQARSSLGKLHTLLQSNQAAVGHRIRASAGNNS